MELYENAQFKVGRIIILGREPNRKSHLIIFRETQVRQFWQN